LNEACIVFVEGVTMANNSYLKAAAMFAILFIPNSAAPTEAERIYWSALRPAEQLGQANQPPSITPLGKDHGELTWEGGERLVQLTGFVLPIDQEGDLVYEFMLVPWAGACSHGASPPPNQMIHVFPEKPFRSTRIYEAVTVTGSLRPGLDKAQLFILDGTRVLTYGYNMSRAEVAKATKLSDPDIRALPPGSLLSR
jgi:hypothetical protein